MKVQLSEEFGFCQGIRRAIRITESNRDAVVIGGRITNNPLEAAKFEKRFGGTAQPDLTQIQSGQKVIIHPHGMTDQEESNLRAIDVNSVDATCPNVRAIQAKVREYDKTGSTIILLGDINHPEVKSIISYAQSGIIVVNSGAELAAMAPNISGHIAILSQSTKDLNELNLIHSWVKQKTGNCTLHNTICGATVSKRSATEKLARLTDVFVVVGGHNSSNSNLLKNVASQYCPAHLVEKPDELDRSWFNGKDLCGLTAGSSIPDSLTFSVKDRLESF